MSLRSLSIVAAAAIMLAVLAFLGQDRSTDASSGNAAPVLPGLADALDEVERVRLVKAGNEVVATLERGETAWRVAERDGYPADFEKLRALLIDLSEARRIEAKTADPDFYERLGVEPVELAAAGGTAVTIEAGDTRFPTVILGDPERTRTRYGRLADEDASFLFDRNPDLPRDTAQWLEPDILDLPAARVREVVIRHGDGETVRIFKEDPGETNFGVADVPPERELRYAGVANVTGNALRELTLEDVAAADQAGTDEADADAPAVTTEFRTFDGLVVTVRGDEREGEAWVSLEAGVDPELAARAQPAGESEADSGEAAGDGVEAAGDGAEAPAEAGEEAPGGEASGDDVAAQAAAINARVSGWRYRIPSHQYDQMTRRMEDLLQAEQ